MTTPDFYLGTGDAPLFSTTVVDATGAPMLIQGAALVMTMVSIRGGAPVDLSGATTVNDDDGSAPKKGTLHRQFLAAETTGLNGLYLVKITGTQAGKPITFPNDGFLIFEVGPTAAQTQRRYVGVEELKNTLTMSGVSFADEDLDISIEAASRYLEDEYNDGRAWTEGQAGEMRYYTRTDDWEVELDDVLAVTSVDLDYALDPWFGTSTLSEPSPSYGPEWGSPIGWGGGSYGTNLPAASYRLLPIQSGLTSAVPAGNGEPYRKLDLARGSQVWRLPSGRDAIRITGTFGWQTVPAGVKVATSMIATRLMRRIRDAPFGLTSFGGDERAVAVRQIATDPDIVAAMQAITATTNRLFA